MRANQTATDLHPRELFLTIARDVLSDEAPWPVTRHLWQARLERVVDWFLAGEIERQKKGQFLGAELVGKIALNGVDFTLSAKADRMDQAEDGSVLIYDYKTGTPPTAKEQLIFDKQLLLEAEMVKRGGFENIGPQRVQAAEYIGLGGTPTVRAAPLEDEEAQKVWDRFEHLIKRYFNPDQGYTAKRAMARTSHESPYDHLARFGEWDITESPAPEVLT
jgi:RecB family exonuclease